MEIPDLKHSQKDGSNTLVRTLRRWLMHPSCVVSVEPLSEHFRLIDLQADALKTLDWTPGQQIQLTTGTGLTARTYTPINWDRNRGITRLLVFLHGDGPGCTWARTVQPGSCHYFLGPTKPTRLALHEPVTLFGDETTFGLGLALQGAATGSIKPHFLFEVSHLEESQRVLDSIGLRGAELVPRSEADKHLIKMATTLSAVAVQEQQVILSGNARSIQTIRKGIATKSMRTPRLIVRPYWSPGKTGMS